MTKMKELSLDYLKKLPKKVIQKAFDEALFLAIGNEDLEKIKNLVKNGANVNAVTEVSSRSSLSNIKTPLMLACDIRNLDIVKFLIDNGADVNARNKRGRNVLFLAAQDEENLEIVKLLVSNGARTKFSDPSGWTSGRTGWWKNCPHEIHMFFANQDKSDE
ncbi:MAG: ankyrin repeat domain-containing protein [Candidatus Paceibacterota bacterium]